jgi:rRNA biogenesis protein RRP5
MWDAIGSSPKKFSLSAAEWVVSMEEKKIDGVKVEDKFPIGTTIEKVKVVRMDDEWGLTVEIVGGGNEEREAGFVHVCFSLALQIFGIGNAHAQSHLVDLSHHR